MKDKPDPSKQATNCASHNNNNKKNSIDRWLVPLPQEDTKKKRKKKPLPHQLTAPYIKNNYVYLSFLTVFTLINVGLFVSRAIQYRNSNGFVIMARACGKSPSFPLLLSLTLPTQTRIVCNPSLIS